MAETVGYVNRARAFMPPGTVPPFVMRFDAGSVPVGNLVFSSETETVAEIQDAALLQVRPIVRDAAGRLRAAAVRRQPAHDRRSRRSRPAAGLQHVAGRSRQALAAGNTISPSGNVRIGDQIPMVPINSVVENIKDLNNVPIRSRDARRCFCATSDGRRRLGHADRLRAGERTAHGLHPGHQTRGCLDALGRRGREGNIAKFPSVLPDDVKVSYEFDQSPYVTRAIPGLVAKARSARC